MKRKISILESIRQAKVGGGESHVYELAKHINRELFELEVLCFSDGPLIKKIEELGIKVHLIQSKHPFDIRTWLKIIRLYRSKRYDLIHAHGSRAASNLFFLSWLTSCKFIYTIHGWSFHPAQSAIVRLLRIRCEAFITRCAELNITVSNSNFLQGQRLFGLKRNKTVYNGIDPRRFDINLIPCSSIRGQFNIPKERTLVGYLVRITEQKDPITFVEAISIVTKETCDVHFLIVGNGNLQPKIRQLISDKKLDEYVSFSNFRDDMPEILKSIDIYCLPSLWEGMPIGMIEAMYMGCACVATSVDGSKELIQHGKTGLLIPPRNPYALAMSLLNLHYNQAKRKLLGKRAQQYAQNRFDINHMTSIIERCYQEICSHSNQTLAS
ncbi:MAG: glycosyltransferase family 1 protein [Bacteroidetes bacterium]|nr:MAG: glycosyltransferase family 1 protein [Bacteroidota bacterium]